MPRIKNNENTKRTDELSFPMYTRQVVSPWHQTSQEQPFAKSEILLGILLVTISYIKHIQLISVGPIYAPLLLRKIRLNMTLIIINSLTSDLALLI